LSIARAHDDEEDRMTFQSHNPATGELIGTYPEHDEAETNVRLQRALEGWLRWSRTPLHERRAFLIRLADLLDGRAETYGRLITAEMGKPLPDAIAKIICGRPPPARGLSRVLATWSGAVICPALSRGACGRWP
jgi:acyl-CoA reductase-like NAD-dependent aldehyde dehydrogenase